MDPFYSSEEDRRTRPPRHRAYRVEPRRSSYYEGEPSRRRAQQPSNYNVNYHPPRRSSRPRRRPVAGYSRYTATQHEPLASATPFIARVDPRPAVFAEEVPLYASRFRTSPSPPGIQEPRQVFVERSSRQDRKHQAAEKRYAFVSPESDASDVEDRARGRSPSPSVRVRTMTRSWSRSPSVRAMYPFTREAIDWENYEDFSFDCKSEAPKNSDSLSFDTSSADPDTSPADANRLIDDSRVKHIYHSRYTGDAETGGSHTAQLTEIHNGSGELFKWLHIQQEVMNFDEFWAEIPRRVHVSDMERRATNRLRADVTRLCVKTRSNPKGVNVGYLEPQFLQTPLEPPKKKLDLDRDEPPPAMVRWLCMPFFILKQYSGLLAGSSMTSFPSQTLLQSQYSRTTQQRDMQQAVCELGIASKGECFHIEQLWCLMVGESLLVTCGSMSRSKLGDNVIKLTSEPSRGLSVASAPGRILVRHGNSLTWSFSPEQCPTWFDFISHFTAFWPTTLEFKKEDAVLHARDWPKLLKFLSSKRHKNVVLTLTTDRERSVASRTLPTPEEEAAKVSATTSDTLLHTLALIVQSSEGEERPRAIQSELKLQLEAADKFLMEQPAYATQAAYSSCADVSHKAILEKLKLQGVKVENEKDDVQKREYEDGIELFNIAEYLFQLFLPLDCDGPTTGKFWGAVLDLACGVRSTHGKTTEDAPPRGGRRDLQAHRETILRTLRLMYPKIKAFQTIMSHVPSEYRLKLEAPRQFVTAWLHIVSGLVLCRAGDASWESHFSIAERRLLSKGMDMMIQALPTYDLLDSVVLQPFEIACLAVLKLMQDRASQPDDINETYSQYLASLDNDITTKPSDRSYQHRIDLVRRELSAVRRTVTRQRHIIATMRQTMHRNAMTDFFRGVDDDAYIPRARYAHHIRGTRNEYYMEGRKEEEHTSFDETLRVSPTDKNGFRGLLLTENSRQLDQRDFEFRRYVEYVDDLERTIAFKMNWTKDRQENAVYAFTIVTIIFLPLSAVASVFGMNTSDVRDMDYSQWLFWVVALPVTILVIVVGLWWMNELGNVVRWLSGRQPDAGGSVMTGFGGVTAEPVEVRYYSDVEEDKPQRYSRRQTLTEKAFSSYDDGRWERRRRERMT
ncbi:hypothetical protein MY3296_008246 [Beauveria thailandica]